MSRNFFIDQTRADRYAAAERFCERDNIRLDTVGKIAAGKEPVSGSADAGLDFVENKNDAKLVAQCTKLAKEFRRRFTHTCHRLDRLDNYSRRIVVRDRADAAYIAKFGHYVTGHVRLADLAIFA